MLFACIQVQAQVNLYSFTQSNETYTEITGGTVLGTATTTTSFDAQNWTLPAASIPFNFNFNGVDYTGCTINSNGFISFGATLPPAGQSSPISAATAYAGAISAWGGDLCGVFISGLIASEARWEIVGTAPNREFVVQFKNWRPTYTSSVTDVPYINFQIRLVETTNQIKFVYGSNGYVAGSAGTSGTRQIGLRGATATDFKTRINSTTQLFTASTTGSANTSAQSFNTAVATPGMPTNGLVYIYTPPVACTGTPVAGTVAPLDQNLCVGSTPAALTLTGNSEGFTGITFQWETSTDNVVWTNATGASATTMVYSPPAFTGPTSVYYRCKITCATSTLFSYSNAVAINPAGNPVGQATNLNFTNISYFGFTANWTNSDGNRRVVYISDSPIVDPINGNGAALTATTVYAGTGQQIVYDNTGATVAITGLNPNTQYYVKVIQYLRCGTVAPFDYYFNTTTGTNANTVTTTPPTSLPWAEGFTATSLPVNWLNTGFTLNNTIAQINPALSTYYIYKNLYASSITANVVTPIFMPLPANHRFVFNYKVVNFSAPYDTTPANSCNIVIAISTNNGTTYTDVVTVPNNGFAGWQTYALNLAAYTGQSVRIKVTTNWISGDYYVAMDNFKIEAIPTCEAPLLTSLTSSNVASSTATVSWIAPTVAPANGYEYYVSTSSTEPASTATPTGTVAAGIVTANLTSLASNTTFYVWVRSNCATNDLSTWSGPVSFTTLCANVTAFTQNFDGVTAGTLPANMPSCWTKVGALGSCYTSTSTPVGSAPNVIYLFGSATSTPTIRMQPVSNLGAGTHRLKFKMRSSSATILPNIDFGYLTDPYDAATFVSLTTFNTTGVTMADYVYEPPTGTYSDYPAIKMNGSVYGTVYLDDFIWEPIPSCIDPSGILYSQVTATTADISWDAPSTTPALGYEYVVSTTSTPPTGAGTAAPFTFAQVTGLTPNAIQYVFVRSVCSATDASPWTGPVSFTTLCANVTSFTQNFDGVTAGTLPANMPSCWTKVGALGSCYTSTATPVGSSPNVIYFNGSSTTAAPTMRMQPVSNLGAGTHRLKFKMRSSSATTLPNIDFGYLTNPYDAATFVSLTSFASTGITMADFVFEPPIGTYSDYPAIKMNGSVYGTVYLDDFIWEAIPACVEPTAIITANITSTSVDMSWTAPSTAPSLGYEYVVSTTSTLPTGAGTGVTNTFAQVTGLTPTTQYYIFVRSNCDALGFSTWTGPVTFTTQCAPITTLPWTEGFEGLTTVGTTNFPPCWSKQNGDWTSVNTNGAYSTAHAGTRYIRNSWAASNEFIWTPGFDLVAGTSYDFSSYVQGDNATGWIVDYFVNTNQNSTGATQVGASYTIPGTGTPYAFQPYNLVTRSFVPTTSGTYYFAVRVNQPSGSNWYASFDDFKLDLSPSTSPACAANLVATPNACGNFANNLTWDLTSTAAGYYVTIGTTSGATDIANAVNVGSNSYSFSGTIGTTYFWKVVPYNAAGSATGCPEQSFTTAATGCYCASVPTSNDGLGITTAVLGTTSNTVADVTYANLTAVPETIVQGANTNLQLTFSTGFVYNVNVWVDFNDDYDFNDAGELVKTGIACTTAQPNTVDASFTMPLTAPTGVHTMRIGSAWNTGQTPPNPCYSGAYGITLDLKVDTAVLSSESFDKATFVAYPNPVKDILNLSYKTVISNVRVINLLGQEVLNTKTNSNEVQVDMSALTAGAYIVNITVEDTIHTIKVIKE